jgi:hypothetical protein
VTVDAPSKESEAPGIRRGLEWDIEEVRRLGRREEDGSDMLVKVTFHQLFGRQGDCLPNGPPALEEVERENDELAGQGSARRKTRIRLR